MRCTLLSKLVATTIESMGLNFQEIVLWTDSTITLHWIATPPYKLKTFVANRVNEIQQYTINFTWRHVVSQYNPADIVSGGIMPQQLCELELWWKGPHILHSREIIIESNNLIINESLVDLELKPENPIISLITSNNINTNFTQFTIFKQFCSYTKLIRITAYCLRFKNRCQRILSHHGQLTVMELETALTHLVKIIQNCSFSSEIKLLSLEEELPINNQLKSLNSFLDKNNILRVGGRLKNANINYDSKHQILLPANHEFVKLMFESEHKTQCHAGPQLLLSIIRQRFWPIAGKSTAKQVVRNCIVCARTKPTIIKQITGDLPAQRVTQTKPFLNTGVDYCGPFYIRNKFQRKSSPYKVYVASFVCFSTKSIHLDIVTDLTSQCFIACLKRFISRHGVIANIWSDNASTFVGANRELKELFQKFISQTEQGKIMSYCTNERINWHFIPPRSPNFGGLWEASIKSFKFHFKRITKEKILTLEEFTTLMIQIEGILNSRPLTCLSDDPNDPEPLTPNHFLTGGPHMTIFEPNLSLIPDNHLIKCQLITKLVESFWKRYSMEYLHTLQTRVKWKQESSNIKINDIVMLVDEHLPSIKWPLGRVISTIQGKYNKVRVVEGRNFQMCHF